MVKKPKHRWEQFWAAHKRKYKVFAGIIALLGTVGGTYKTWAPYFHEWFTPEFKVEFHMTWNYEGSQPPMTTPFRSVNTNACGEEAFDEVVYAEIVNNHNHSAIIHSIAISIEDWTGWHDATLIQSSTPLVFIPDRGRCSASGASGTGCYYEFGDNREYRLDSVLPRITLEPKQSIRGYFLTKWDSYVNPKKIIAYRVHTIDDEKEKSDVTIDGPNASSHKNDTIYVAYTTHPIAWTPRCQDIPQTAEK
jgi:hypothetical protein